MENSMIEQLISVAAGPRDEAMQVTAYGTTDVGNKRKRNEDAYLIDEQLRLFVVCDGMGGHAAGDVAAQKTIEFMADLIRQNKSALCDAQSSPDGESKIAELVKTATVQTGHHISELASAHAEYAGMGTTMTMLSIVGNKGAMSHIGDSRLYLLRSDNLKQLSTDHTLANDLLHCGILTNNDFEISCFHHMLTRAIGRDEIVECDTLLFDVLPEDRFLLCSDGLTRHVGTSAELTGLLRRPDLASIPEELVTLANHRGGLDNITVVVVHVTADD